jgi:hypothetical protein
MLKCGQEEPINPNDYIRQFDEIMHWSVLSDVDDPRLNRYSFVWLGRWSEGQSALARVVQAIMEETRVTATWVEAFRIDGWDRIRTKVSVKGRTKQGWSQYEDDTLAVVVSPPTNSIPDTLALPTQPGYSTGAHNKLLLFLGPTPPPDVLAREPLRRTMDDYAPGWDVRPSRWFLNWLAIHQHTIVYRARSHAGHEGLIIVGTLRILTEKLLAAGVIQDILEGEQAGRVWSYPPSYGA